MGGEAVFKQSCLTAKILDVGIAARAYGVLILRFVSEWIVAARAQTFKVDERAPSFTGCLYVDTGAVSVKRADTRKQRKGVPLRAPRLQIDGST